VVGVVGDVKRFALEYQLIPEFYLPLLQTKGTDFGLEQGRNKKMLDILLFGALRKVRIFSPLYFILFG